MYKNVIVKIQHIVGHYLQSIFIPYRTLFYVGEFDVSPRCPSLPL
jgi:hypothetical protein